MRFGSTILVLAFALPAFASPHARRGPTSQHFSSKRSHPSAKPAVQRGIDTGRTTQIQTALIQHGYLEGTATGEWTPETQAALRKLQGDNGWQTKFVPDSRAIIKLGLGPGSPSSEGALLSGSSVAASPVALDADSLMPSQR